MHNFMFAIVCLMTK